MANHIVKLGEYKTGTRLDHIDLLKALAIYLVVIYHFNNIPVNIVEAGGVGNYFNLYFMSIVSVCVPVFFFVNGLLLLNKKIIDINKHIKKILNLLILTVLWGLITLVTLTYIRGEELSLRQIINGVWYVRQGWNNHLWFLSALVVLYVFYPLIHEVYQRKKNAFYFFLACVMLFTFGNVALENIATTLSYFSNKFVNTDFDLNYFTDFNAFRGIYGYSIGYFMLGGLVGGGFHALSNSHKQKLTILATAAIPVSMLGLFSYAVMVSFRHKEMWDIVWEGFDTVFTLVNVVALYVISARYRSVGWFGNFISMVGKNSLGIYFIHVIVGNILTPFFMRLDGSTMFSINIVYALIILLCSLIFAVFLRKIPIINKLVSI